MTKTPQPIQDIIAQLGGPIIFRMAFAGSTYATGGATKLTLRIAPALTRSTKGKATHVVVSLNAMDTYDVEICRIRSGNCGVISYLEDIYADQLREVVERETGLALTLGNMRGAPA